MAAQLPDQGSLLGANLEPQYAGVKSRREGGCWSPCLARRGCGWVEKFHSGSLMLMECQRRLGVQPVLIEAAALTAQLSTPSVPGTWCRQVCQGPILPSGAGAGVGRGLWKKEASREMCGWRRVRECCMACLPRNCPSLAQVLLKSPAQGSCCGCPRGGVVWAWA